MLKFFGLLNLHDHENSNRCVKAKRIKHQIVKIRVHRTRLLSNPWKGRFVTDLISASYWSIGVLEYWKTEHTTNIYQE